MITLKLIGAPAFSVEARKDGAFVYAAINDALCVATGLRRETFVGRTPEECFPGEMGRKLVAHYVRAAESGQEEWADFYDLPEGSMWWRVTLTFIAEETDERRGFLLGICVDVTKEKRAETELREANLKLELAFDAIGGAYWQYDLTTDEFDPSPSLALVAGEPAQRKLGLHEWRILILPEDLPRVTFLPLVEGERERMEIEYRIRRTDGEVRWMRCVSRAVCDPDGTPSRILGVTLDVTGQKLREFDLMRDASRDSLTGLGNRRAFESYLSSAFAHADRTGHALTLMLLDLDRFKPVNDRFGHAVGDQVLVEAAARIKSAIRPYDMAARLGGDEFVVVAQDLDSEDAIAMATRIRDLFSAQFPTEIGRVPVGVSVGIAQHEKGGTIDQILREADANLYVMKRSRGPRGMKGGSPRAA